MGGICTAAARRASPQMNPGVGRIMPWPHTQTSMFSMWPCNSGWTRSKSAVTMACQSDNDRASAVRRSASGAPAESGQ